MENTIMLIISLLTTIGVVIMLIKKMDIKITLFCAGIILMYVAILFGKPVLKEPVLPLIDPILAVIEQFKRQLTGAGLIILMLGGYSAYMSKIGANNVTINALTHPLRHLKSVYLLVPIVFLLGNLLSLVIPSASNLAIILMATLFPVLKKAGMTTLTAAAVIATTATVMPTPLGADNIAVAAELGISVTEYVLKYHAIVSVPTLLAMAITHLVWQKFCDKKIVEKEEIVELQENEIQKNGFIYNLVYALLPLLPIIILLCMFVYNIMTKSSYILSVEVVVIFSFIIAIFCEYIKKRKGLEVIQETESFFDGMGKSIGIIVLLVAASIYVQGLRSIGLIDLLQNTMSNTTASGFVLPLILVLLTALIVLLSGSGVALFYAMVPLMIPLANAANISPFAVTVPMGLAGNLLRAVSPVAAVVVIVAGSTKKDPIEIVKRTAIPMLAGVIFMFILSMILFL